MKYSWLPQDTNIPGGLADYARTEKNSDVFCAQLLDIEIEDLPCGSHFIVGFLSSLLL